MEHAIAVDWVGFSGNPESVLPEDHKWKSGAEPEAGEARQEDTREAMLQRLEDALASPSAARPSAGEEPIALCEGRAIGVPTQEKSSAAAQSNREGHRGWRNSPRDPAHSAPQTQAAAGEEKGTYQTRFMWVGTGFEEREIFIADSRVETAAPQPRHESTPEEISLEPDLKEISAQVQSLCSSAEAAVIVAPEPQPQRVGEEDLVHPAHPSAPEQVTADVSASAPYSFAAAPAQAPSNGTKTSHHLHGAPHWFVLDTMFGGTPAPQPSPAYAPAGNVPVLAVFSLAGGVGKTSLVATLGRALSALGEHVLLMEATPFGSLPYFFGACDCRPGELRTFRPPASSSDAPIRMATVDAEMLLAEPDGQDAFPAEIQSWASGVNRIIVDVATGSAAAAQRLSRLSPLFLVPLIPDVNAVLTAKSIDAFFQHRVDAHGAAPQIYYLLNQVDPSLPLHVELAEVLREKLGERLLPLALERNPAVSEALADGMTIIDYAPQSSAVEDYISLARWVESVMSPALMNVRSTRWSER